MLDGGDGISRRRFSGLPVAAALATAGVAAVGEASAATDGGAALRAANLRLVQRVYDEVLGPIDPGPVDEIFAPDYIQHNPNVVSGSQGLKDMLIRSRKNIPNAEHHVKRILVDGNMAMAHVHVIFRPGQERGHAAVDIFRIENGKIAEHWDVTQDIPATAANTNGMF
jgi:predicted SnoaL-like aldol condensation-catalyzing enzyme